MEIHQETVSFIDKIYGTITQPNSWDKVLCDLSNHFDLMGMNIFCWDGVHQELSKSWMTPHLERIFPAFCASGYLEEEAKVFSHASIVQENPELIDTNKWMELAYKKTGIRVDTNSINTWLAEHGDIHQRYTSLLNAKPGYIDFISLHAGKNHQASKEHTLEQVNFLLPHIQRAIYINRPFSILQERYNAVLEVLDKFKLGVAVIDKQLDLLLHNHSAELIFAHKDGLSQNGNRLTVDNASQRGLIINAIHKLREDPAKVNVLPVERRSQALPYLCHLSRIQLSLEASNVYLMIILDPERSDIVNIEGLTTIFELTKREKDIAQGIVSGYSNQEIADINNIAVETVKSHTKSIARKTQCNNRLDIIQLAHRTCIPIQDKEGH